MKLIKSIFKKNNIDSTRDDISVILRAIKQGITDFGLEPTLGDGYVSLGSQQRILVPEFDVWKHETNRGWICHASFLFQLNPEIKESWVLDCASGVGNTKTKALEDAALAWVTTTSPTVLSLLKSAPMYGASKLKPNDPEGFLNWEAFSGPLYLRGDDEPRKILGDHITENPVIPKLATIINQDIDSDMLVGIRLFWGPSNDGSCARVAINDVEHAKATEKLKELSSTFPEAGKHAMFGQFILLLKQVHDET